MHLVERSRDILYKQAGFGAGLAATGIVAGGLMAASYGVRKMREPSHITPQPPTPINSMKLKAASNLIRGHADTLTQEHNMGYIDDTSEYASARNIQGRTEVEDKILRIWSKAGSPESEGRSLETNSADDAGFNYGVLSTEHHHTDADPSRKTVRRYEDLGSALHFASTF